MSGDSDVSASTAGGCARSLDTSVETVAFSFLGPLRKMDAVAINAIRSNAHASTGDGLLTAGEIRRATSSGQRSGCDSNSDAIAAVRVITSALGEDVAANM